MTPTPLTDEEIVRTLAEFMGRRVVPATNGVCFWFQEDVNDGLEDAEPVSYLTSYDALAPVWRKLRNQELVKGLKHYNWAWWNEQSHPWWFDLEPKDMAHALAQEIKEKSK